MTDPRVMPTQSELEKLQAAVVDAHIKAAEMRSLAQRAHMYMVNAQGLLTPGMKAGVGEAKSILTRGIDESGEALGL